MDLKNKSRPYYTANDFYLDRFGTKVFKVPVNGGFTCPNRDGTLSKEGCLYCSETGSGEFAGKVTDSLAVQYQQTRAMMNAKWPAAKTIVYFQAFTNTYAPVSRLRELFETALKLDKDIVGLSIATRPDCLPDDVVEYLSDLNRRTFLTVEVGLQTIHKQTAMIINRRHDLDTFASAVAKLSEHGIHTVAHIIDGLPGESKEMMLDTIRYLNTKAIQGVKIHMLYILKNTRMADYYRDHPFPILSREEYVDIVADQIELLRPDIVLYRLTGDARRSELLEPFWTQKKFVVTNEIDKLLRKRKSFQGAKYQNDQR